MGESNKARFIMRGHQHILVCTCGGEITSLCSTFGPYLGGDTYMCTTGKCPKCGSQWEFKDNVTKRFPERYTIIRKVSTDMMVVHKHEYGKCYEYEKNTMTSNKRINNQNVEVTEDVYIVKHLSDNCKYTLYVAEIKNGITIGLHIVNGQSTIRTVHNESIDIKFLSKPQTRSGDVIKPD